MTTAADDPAVEDAFEAYLAGRPVPEQGAGLATFAQAVRRDATRPGRPSAALAELLATGLLTDQPAPSTRTARSAGSPPSRGPARSRRRLAVILPALLAKFLSAGALAQAATGAGVVLVAVTGAGAAGVLPDPLQNTVAAAVETVTPFELPGDEETPVGQPVSEEPVLEEEPVLDETPVEAAPGTFDADTWLLGPQEAESFGGWVSQAAGNQDFKAALKAEGLSFGQVVRTWAQRKGLDEVQLESELVVEGVDVAEITDEAAPDATPTTGAEPQVATAPADTGRGNGRAGDDKPGKGAAGAASQGKGNGQGQGNGRN